MSEKIFNFMSPGPRWIWFLSPQIESVIVRDQGISIKLGAKRFDFLWSELDKLLYIEDWISYENSGARSNYSIVTVKGKIFTFPLVNRKYQVIEKYQLIMELKKHFLYEEKIYKTRNNRELIWGLVVMFFILGILPLILAVFFTW